MRLALLVALHLVLQPVLAAYAEPVAVVPWFTDAEIEGGERLPSPPQALPGAAGTFGRGVRLTQACPIEAPLLSQEHGYISFWLRPDWNGSDGETHRILRIGDPATNGILVEKSDKGMFRYVMASAEKVTASRADVSHWKAGEWHHVVVVWMSKDGAPLGTPLWIDKVAVDSAIAAGNTFIDPAAMDDQRVWIGDETSDAVMDELIVRKELRTELSKSQIQLVHRDHYRTAPYTAIAINHEACFVQSDKRVVEGAQKQFGLLAERGDRFEPVTNFDVRYGQWSEFDAKPFITWSTSDEKIATVDANGLVSGHAVGRCTLTAEFRGMRATYDVRVVPVEQPDLVLICVSRLPRYRWDEEKDRPAPGDAVKFVARVANFGYKPVPKGAVVQIEYVPDANGNFVLDARERPVKIERKTIDQELAPRDEVEIEFPYTYTNEPVWTRVTVDPRNRISEICEANNQRSELSNARPVHFGYEIEKLDGCYSDRIINHVGSFCYYDWLNGQKARLDHLVREAVHETTSPEGIHDSYRTDKLTLLKLGDTPWREEEWEREAPYYDGGFPVREPVNFMAIDSAIMHEFGHTIMALPDLYGYPMNKSNVLLKDENGEYYSGGPLLPTIDRYGTLPQTPALNDPCNVGYNPLMGSCHQWLHPAQAGQVHYYRGYRGPRFWGTQGRHIPKREHFLKIYDVSDDPLAGAAVYVYHVTQTRSRNSATKFFADRPKFVGHVDADGRFKFQDRTDKDWDDPDTDLVEGDWPVWNPFGRAKTTTGAPPDTAFTPNVWCVEGLLLLKIVSGDQTEFQWMPMTTFNIEFFKGNVHRGVYEIRTSLPRSDGKTPVVRPEIPDAIREKNLAPVAVTDVKELTVQPGEEFVIDGSGSHDPEEQPLIYRWEMRHKGGDRGIEPRTSDGPAYEGTAPDEPAEYECVFYVIDGLRASEPLWIKVHVVNAEGESE